ncbi:hypothetical protein M9H77_28500 [Catharanthus roseus]|uniref:Uncharacterized protein n=1 Tax=Catharanthus roseus TaxID=4058 RepID=A0ACC0AGX7_CATRO|nr:hypothetical protein M9H77_28500 [Catharanthus roseus]
MIQYMPLFRACSNSRTLTQLHAKLIITGLHKDPVASTKLMESYAEVGLFDSSMLVFDNFPRPDSFMWGVIIKCHVWNGFFQESLSLYHNLLFQLTQLSSFIFPSVLRACSAIGNLGFGQKVHGSIIKYGFESDSVIETALLNMYGEMGCLDNARKVFDFMPMRDVVSWSSILSSYVQNGLVTEALDIFGKMVAEGLAIDAVTMLIAAEACGELGLWRLGKSLHGFVVRRDIYTGGGRLDTSLIAMYGKCGDLISSERLFAKATDKNTSLWTAMISSYHQNGCHEEALKTFLKMKTLDVEPNAVTMICVLSSCARLGWLEEGKSIHGFVIRTAIDLESDLLGPALVDLYASCGRVRDCDKVFDITQEMRTISWNMLISGYAQEGMAGESLNLFKQMLVRGVVVDCFTLSSVLSICGDVGFSKLGHQIHSYVLKTTLSNEFVQNSLISMYSKCGLVDSALIIFDDVHEKGVVTWNNMICGFSQNGNLKEAIAFFREMYSNSLEMNEVTFLTIVQACSSLGCIEKGKLVHQKLISYGLREDMYISTALIDMYAKCGDPEIAQRVFDTMSDRNVVSWSTLIGAYGMHGHVDAAIGVFHKMIESGIRPNAVTFMNLLSACSHAGYLEEGKSFFNRMTRSFGIQPNSDHYGCLVDLLSRAGDLNGAQEVIASMPPPVHASIWSSLVNGCRIHQRMDVVESITENLVNICTDDTGYYTLLSNLYAEEGEWVKFITLRTNMKRRGLQKVQGCSMIEVDRRVHRFGAYDESSSQKQDIYCLLDNFHSWVQSHISELDAFVA